MSYEPPNEVTVATDAYLKSYADKGSPVPQSLLALLECPYSVMTDDSFHILLFPTCNPKNKEAIRESLPKVFRLIASPEYQSGEQDAQLLFGINNAKCWRTLLSSEDDTYLLAASIVHFAEKGRSPFQLSIKTSKHVCEILNAWLRPEKPWAALPEVESLCAHLFGGPWVDLVLSSSGSKATDNLGESRQLILRERPPFLPGLCQAQEMSSGATLPEKLGP